MHAIECHRSQYDDRISPTHRNMTPIQRPLGKTVVSIAPLVLGTSVSIFDAFVDAADLRLSPEQVTTLDAVSD